MLNNLFTEDSGDLRLFLSTSHKWQHCSVLHGMSEIYPMCTLGPITAFYHVCQCFYDCWVGNMSYLLKSHKYTYFWSKMYMHSIKTYSKMHASITQENGSRDS